MAAAAALSALLSGAPAWADVRAGVDAWSRSDYATAVREWESPAAAGDPDAMFNLAQAYRLGRGVPADPARAEALYARAAAAGHLQAADTYGLMLFQEGRREAALPYIEGAASRGDPRAAYLLGIAHFNGDIVPKDWLRAYALLTLANAQGLPQAAPALAQMDQHIPLAQRQQAAGLAVDMQRQADAARGRQLAAADLGVRVAAAAVDGAPVQASPLAADARTAVAEASRATGAESPAEAGADFARPVSQPTQVAAAASPPQEQPVARPAAAASDGPWRVQLGAFSVRGNAESLWAKLSGRNELAGKTRLLVPAGRVTKLQAGGYASRDTAETACRSLKRTGQECLVTR